MLRILSSLIHVKCIFFSFYRSVGFEENIKYTKKFLMPAMECSFHFGYVSTIVLTFLQVYFPEATVINLFAILRVFRVGLGMAVSSKRVKRFEGKLNLPR